MTYLTKYFILPWPVQLILPVRMSRCPSTRHTTSWSGKDILCIINCEDGEDQCSSGGGKTDSDYKTDKTTELVATRLLLRARRIFHIRFFHFVMLMSIWTACWQLTMWWNLPVFSSGSSICIPTNEINRVVVHWRLSVTEVYFVDHVNAQ